MLFVPLPPPSVTGGVYAQRSRIDQGEYLLRFAHASRTDSWTLDIAALGSSAAEADPVVTGKKLFVGHDLLAFSLHSQRPPGRLFLLRLDGSLEAPTGASLHRYRLVYLFPGELDGSDA